MIVAVAIVVGLLAGVFAFAALRAYEEAKAERDARREPPPADQDPGEVKP